MEVARTIFLEIATVSRRIVSSATEHARHQGFRNVQSCFRLGEEMEKISVAAEGILGVLSKSSPSNGSPLDDRLRDWFSTDEPSECMKTLQKVKKTLLDDTWMNTIFNFVNTFRSMPQEDKIDAALKLFDSQRNYFHFLLTTDVWNSEDAQQQLAPSAHPHDAPVVQRMPEPNIHGAMEDNSASNKVVVIKEKEMKQIDATRKLDEILSWLDGLSCAAKQEETMSLRQPDTCTWLHSTPEYQKWRDDEGSCLWLQGKPGSGKTVLASFVIDSLKSKRRGGEALAFFYCDFRNDRSTSAAGVMRSLLSQLLRHLRNENIDPGELVDDLVREKNDDTPILENVKRLATFVSRTTKQFSHPPLVIVDALDECKNVKRLLDGLVTLAKGSMRLLVTSRPLQIIKDVLYDLPSISMDKMTDAVSTDIALHVTRELDSSPRLRALDLRFKTEIFSILCDRADGMFRWVQCQIDTLNRCATKAEVREALDNLPNGLDETYERILVSIDIGSPEGKLALRALVWLVGALRPFRMDEVLEGLTIDLGRRTIDPETGAMHKGILLYACGSLVTYNEKTDILILSHFSVKEYLTGDLTRIKLWRYHIDYQNAHEDLGRLCLCYIALYLKHVHQSSENSTQFCIMRAINGLTPQTIREWYHLPENSPVVFSLSQELLGYVFTEGFNHLAYLGSANCVILEDMVTLQSDIQHHPAAWEKICHLSQRHKLPISWPSSEHDFMLYVLTAFGSHSLLHAFLGPTRRILKPKYRTNPLVYAAHFGKLQHARLLLSHGAKINEKGLVVDASRMVLPLEVAVSRQHDALVGLLLSAGSVVPKQLFIFSTNRYFPIRIARRLLQTDEFIEWAAEPSNRPPSPKGLLERQPPFAYERDLIIMIRRLAQVGLDTASRNSAGRTALDLAITGGYNAVFVYLLLSGSPLPPDFTLTTSRITFSARASLVRLIVDIGLDVRVRGTGDTTLHLVIRFFEQDECLVAIKALVGAGYKPLLYNHARQRPLHLALEKGYSAVADYLLLQQPTSPDDLSAVVESACPTTWVIETLRAGISDQANIQCATAHGDCLLHQAVTHADKDRALEVAKLLVSAGCDPFKCNDRGETPLDLVLNCRYSLLADYLLSIVNLPPPDTLFAILRSALPAVWRAQTVTYFISQGIDTSTVSADGDTLLHTSILSLDEHKATEVTKLLVGAGCDPFKRNDRGETPFNLVLRRKYSLLADYLLSTVNLPPPDTLFAILRSTAVCQWRAQTVTYFISQGIDTSTVSADGDTLLHTSILSLDEYQAMEVAKLLVGAGCDPFKHNDRGETPFNLVLRREYSLLADYLLSTVNLPPPDTLFAILRSALPAVWRVQTVTYFIGRGIDTSTLSADGNTLLHATVLFLDETQALEVAKTFVGAGCSPSTRNRRGETIFHIAAEKGFISFIEYILSTLDRSLLDDILLSADWIRPAILRTLIDILIDKGANIRVVTSDGNNLLHSAISSHYATTTGILETVKILVDSGCDAFAPNFCGETPLHLAVAARCVPVVEYLLSITTLPYLPGDILVSALRREVASSSVLHILQLLIAKGANIHACAANGDTLLHMALKNFLLLSTSRLLEITTLLVDSGSNPSQCDADGRPPLYFAITGGRIKIVKYLLPRTSTLNLNLQDAIHLAPLGVRNGLREILEREGFVLGKRKRDYDQDLDKFLSRDWDF